MLITFNHWLLLIDDQFQAFDHEGVQTNQVYINVGWTFDFVTNLGF